MQISHILCFEIEKQMMYEIEQTLQKTQHHSLKDWLSYFEVGSNDH